MADTLPIAIVAGLLAGGAGAAATTVFLAPSGAETSTLDGADESSLLADLRTTNSRLSTQVEDQAARIAALEESLRLAPVQASGSAPVRVAASEDILSDDYVTRGELEQILKELATEKLAVVNPAARQTVEAVMDDIEEQRRQERDERREADREKRREDRLAQMQSDLGLTGDQLEDMRTAMANGEQRMRDFWSDEANRGLPRDEMREQMRVMREEGSAEVQAILSPSQYETYQEKGYDNPWGMRGGRGGGGGAPGGNNRGGGRGGF